MWPSARGRTARPSRTRRSSSPRCRSSTSSPRRPSWSATRSRTTSRARSRQAYRESCSIARIVTRRSPRSSPTCAPCRRPSGFRQARRKSGRKPAPLLHSIAVSEGTKIQAERRRQILDAAVRAFARKGYHACRVSDIATEAGVAYGLVYHYYGSKEALLEAIFKETWGAMLATVRSVEEADQPAREQVRKVTEIILRTWKRDPDLVRVLVREVTRSSQVQEETEDIDLAYPALQRIVERGQ